jgi:hypothetical protein
MIAESLIPKPGIREQYRHKADMLAAQLTPSFAKARKTSSAEPVRSRSLIGVTAVIWSIVMPGTEHPPEFQTSLLRRSEVCHQAHESLVLMILVMAVEQRRSRIVGDEVDLDRAIPRHVDSIFHYAGCSLVADLGDLERVAM